MQLVSAVLPHIIVLEIFEEEAAKFNKKPLEFKVNNATYAIDSAVIRDVSQQHFCFYHCAIVYRASKDESKLYIRL